MAKPLPYFDFRYDYIVAIVLLFVGDDMDKPIIATDEDCEPLQITDEHRINPKIVDWQHLEQTPFLFKHVFNIDHEMKDYMKASIVETNRLWLNADGSSDDLSMMDQMLLNQKLIMEFLLEMTKGDD